MGGSRRGRAHPIFPFGQSVMRGLRVRFYPMKIGKCDQRTYAFANVALSIDITVDGMRTVQPHLAFPKFSLRSPGAPPAGLKAAGGVSKQAKGETSHGNAKLHGAFALFGPKISGWFDSTVTLTVEPNFYCDCDGTYCLKGNLQDIKLRLKFEDPHTIGHPRVCEIDHTFETMSWDDGCKPPDWQVCCEEKGICLDFDLDRFLVTQDLEMTVSGEAVLNYQVWYWPTLAPAAT